MWLINLITKIDVSKLDVELRHDKRLANVDNAVKGREESPISPILDSPVSIASYRTIENDSPYFALNNAIAGWLELYEGAATGDDHACTMDEILLQGMPFKRRMSAGGHHSDTLVGRLQYVQIRQGAVMCPHWFRLASSFRRHQSDISLPRYGALWYQTGPSSARPVSQVTGSQRKQLLLGGNTRRYSVLDYDVGGRIIEKNVPVKSISSSLSVSRLITLTVNVGGRSRTARQSTSHNTCIAITRLTHDILLVLGISESSCWICGVLTTWNLSQNLCQ